MLKEGPVFNCTQKRKRLWPDRETYMPANETPPATHSQTKRILLIFSGVKFDLEQDCGLRLQLLSQRFEGASFAAHTSATSIVYGRFHLTTVTFSRNRFLFSLRFFLGGIAWGLRERRRGYPIGLVTTTDPLKTGILGWLIAKIVGAKFAPEVNGEYWDRNNYIDVPGRITPWIKRMLLGAVATRVLKSSDGIRTLYPTQIDFLKPVIGAKVIRAISEFTDIRHFVDYGEERVVLFVGFPFYRKGVDVLIEAFKCIAPRYPDWKLKILGWFPDRSTFERHRDGHSQIFLHDAVYHREMPQHIGRSAIVVLPSRSEGMGRVLIEAMASGKARIGADVGGIPTVIADGKDGLLFQVGDVEQLAERLERLISSDALRRQLGLAARERVMKEFTLDRYLERIGAFYDDVLLGDTAGRFSTNR